MSEFASLSGPDPIETWFAEVIVNAELARPRTQQVAIGPSELGNPCDRALAYRLSGAHTVHYADPLKANIGTGFHEYVGAALGVRDNHHGRYLLEYRVAYRGVEGNVDIFDRWHGRLVDLKTLPMQKLRRIRFKGSPESHRVQTQVYAAGLMAAGHDVRSVTVLYVPTDGTLADVLAVTSPVDVAVADAAIDRLEAITNRGADPQDVPAFPTPLCGWCDFYAPGRPATSRTCPGGTAEADAEFAAPDATAHATGTEGVGHEPEAEHEASSAGRRVRRAG